MIELFNSYTQYTADPDANAPYLLQPAECYISAALNGEWCLYLTCYRDERGDWLQVVPDAILRVPQWQYRPMTGMFRIKTVERTDTMVTATADPIAYDAAGDCICYDVRPTNATGIQALQAILAGNNRYSCVSDISKTSTAYYIRKNALEAINGSEENSFLNRWGGEISYLNNVFSVLSRQGADNGVVVSFRRDFALDGLRYMADLTDSINTIVPLAYNGHGLSTNPPSVSTLAPPNAPVRTGVVTFENIRLSSDSGFSPGETIPSYITICANQAALDTALTQAANDYFAETNCAYPKIELECDLIALQNLEEYKGFQALETVSLGDTVHIRDGIMGLDGTPLLTARIMEIEWDCIHDRARRIVARSDDSQRSAVGGTAISVGAGTDPFQVDENGNIVMGDKLIFGNPNITIPTYLLNIFQSTNGSDFLIRPGGRLVIGGGEYASNRYAEGSFEGTEGAWLGADGSVYIESNANTIANRKKWAFNTAGELIAPNGTKYANEYKNETVTISTPIYGHGYSGASYFYIDVELPKKIAVGSTASVTALKAGLRGVNGTVIANQSNLLSPTNYLYAASVTETGLLRLQLSGLTTNFVANTPAVLTISSLTVAFSS